MSMLKRIVSVGWFAADSISAKASGLSANLSLKYATVLLPFADLFSSR